MTQKAFAKVNIFLKIVGKRGSYHELISRFVLHQSLYDTLHFVTKQKSVDFELQGNFSCVLEDNTLFKAYLALCEAGYEKEIKDFMGNYALHVDKNIPSFAGLGGGSSDAATFLLMLNEYANLQIQNRDLMQIGAKVGADVPFFISGFTSANVSGIGEIVEPFEEELLHLQTYTPDIPCDTAKVYKAFGSIYKEEKQTGQDFATLSSRYLMEHYDAMSLNDLFEAALQIYPNLYDYYDKDWFFSGSGSTFFRLEQHG